MATRKRTAKKRRQPGTELAGLAEVHPPEQVDRLTARLAESDWSDWSLRGPDYDRLDQLLSEHEDGEAAAEVFIAEMAEQGINPLSARRLFPTTPISLAAACRRLHFNISAIDLLHEQLVAHGIDPAFGGGNVISAFVDIFCDETAGTTDFEARIIETVKKLDDWRRREEERTLLACPRCGSSRLSRVEVEEVIHPLRAVWQDGNGDQGWEDLDDDESEIEDDEDDDLSWGRGGAWTSNSWFEGIFCDECRETVKPGELDRLVPAAKQPSNFAVEPIAPLSEDAGWAREEKFPGKPTIEALLDDAERQVRGWWSGDISNAGVDLRGQRSNRWFYRVEKRQIQGRPIPLTLGTFLTPRSYREAVEWANGAEAALVVFEGHHEDRPSEEGMVLIAIRPEEAKTRWIPFVPDPDDDDADAADDAPDAGGPKSHKYVLLSDEHEDVEPVASTRPLVELVQQKLRG